MWSEDFLPYKDPARRRAYGRDWIKRNPEKAREAMRRWRAGHPEERAAQARIRYLRHGERLRAQIAAYHAANPHVRRTGWERRRARQLNAEGSYTTKEWLSVLERYHWRCAYCGTEGALQADHRIPLSRGGTNFIDNILPACPSCNLRKHKLTEAAFRERLSRERGDDRSGRPS